MGTEAAWIPLAMGAMGALGASMGGGGEFGRRAMGSSIKTHPTYGISAPGQMSRYTQLQQQLANSLLGRAQQPVYFPSAIVGNQNPVFGGGGMAMPVFASGQDPALFQQELAGAPGLNLGGGPANPVPQVGSTPETAYTNPWGGHTGTISGADEGLGSALEMLGVETDNFGNLFMGGENTDLFTGANTGTDPHDPTTGDPNKPQEGPGEGDINTPEDCEVAGGEWDWRDGTCRF